MKQMNKEICQSCMNECKSPCAAFNRLYMIYETERKKEKTKIVKKLRKELEVAEIEPSKELEALANKIIKKFDVFQIIPNYDISIGYVNSEEYNRRGEKTIYADTRKVHDVYKAYLPFDFIITFYGDSEVMSENQRKVLMYHELKHVGIGPKGLKINEHDVEDFVSILVEHGLDWNSPLINEDLKDILGGGKQ